MVFENNHLYEFVVENISVPNYQGRIEKSSNAQQFARELTITEKLLCRIYLKRQEAIEKGLIKIKP